MFYASKFVIVLIIFFFINRRKCEIVKHKIIFKNVGSRFPKILSIVGLLAGMNLLKNFHVEAGKQENFGKQFNTLTFEFETEQNPIGNNGIETIIHGNSEQLYPILQYYTPQYFQKRSDDKYFKSKNINLISNNRRTRRSLKNWEAFSNNFRKSKQMHLDEEILINSSTEILSDDSKPSESNEKQEIPNNIPPFLKDKNSNNISTVLEDKNANNIPSLEDKNLNNIPPSLDDNLNNSNITETPDTNTGYIYTNSTGPSNSVGEGYFYVKPSPHVTYGLPTVSDNHNDNDEKIPALSYGPPIYNLSPPSQQDPQQFRPPITNIWYGLPSLTDNTYSNTVTQYHITWPFCLSYQRYPVSKFKPSIPDLNRNHYESHYNNYNGFYNNGAFRNLFKKI